MPTKLALAAMLFFAVAGYCQTREQVESRLARLPPDQRAYERFRYWQTMLPAGQQKDPDLLGKYRVYLRGQGFTDSDVEAQIKLIAERGQSLEVERWNQILTAEKPRFNINPNAFLVEMAEGRKPGTALDVGMGQGRNAIWLAQQGWSVTGFDPADKAVALANQTASKLGLHLNTVVTTDDKFDFGENRWDLILFSYAGGRGMTDIVQKALKPHGIVVIEAFHRDATRGTSIGGGVVFDTGELVMLFPRLRVVRYEEPIAVADFGQDRLRLVRYCAEKPE
ncbi:MAG TPA: methyltransferase domain-containing protein [Bryobacteraceae bacterium]|nr:methyltransferase domain-containing protein [Bryobacteraceae bacterium]